MAIEHEFESYAESQAYWTKHSARPEVAEVMKELREMLTEAVWRVEQWELVE